MKKLLITVALGLLSFSAMSDTIRNTGGVWKPYDCPATGSCHLACVTDVKAETPPGDAGDCRTTFSGQVVMCDPLGVGACSDLKEAKAVKAAQDIQKSMH